MRNMVYVFVALLVFGIAFGAPTANAGNPKTANVGTSVSFDASLSTCSGCTIVSYNWNFDDGYSGTGISTAHAYSSTGTYTASLVVVDDTGSVDSDTVQVTINSIDTTPPTVTHTNVSSASNSSTISVIATVTDNVAVQSVTLYYKNSALSNESGSWSSATMTASGSTYSSEIPLSSINTSGVMYYISAMDTSSNSKASPANTSQSDGTSVYSIAISSTDTSPPITVLVSVTNDTSSPFWLTSNSTSNVVVRVSGESGMACRISEYATNYSNQLSYGGSDCTVSSSTATCTTSLSTDRQTYFYVGCKDSSNNVQPLSNSVNVTVGADTVVPTAISNLTAHNPSGFVYLTWNDSSDATSGLSGQRIYRWNATSGNWSLVSTTSASATTWVDTSALSSNNYIYTIRPFDIAGNEQTSNANASVTVQLYSGWNLVGIPQNITNTSIASVLSTLNLSNVEKVLYYNGSVYLTYVPNYGGTLTTMEPGKAYLVRVSGGSGENLNTRGARVGSYQLSLSAGWNIVSYPRLFSSARTLSSLLSSISGSYSSVLVLNGTSASYTTASGGTTVTGGQGFWIYMTQAANLTIN